MPSPFPGMDPFVETNPIFQELHTQMLAEMQAVLQPQLRPKYVARLERHLSRGSIVIYSAGPSAPGCHGHRAAESRKQAARRRRPGTLPGETRRGTARRSALGRDRPAA